MSAAASQLGARERSSVTSWGRLGVGRCQADKGLGMFPCGKAVAVLLAYGKAVGPLRVRQGSGEGPQPDARTPNAGAPAASPFMLMSGPRHTDPSHEPLPYCAERGGPPHPEPW